MVGKVYMSDFIQEQVNKANEESLERFRKRLQRKIEHANYLHNQVRKKRKLERKNRKGGR